MSTATGTQLIPASADRVRALLLEPLRLPDWNPAFLAIDGPAVAAVGASYALRTLPNLRGTFHYGEIGTDRIRMEWDVPGMHERCEWILRPGSGGAGAAGATEVTHTVERTGPLAVVLHHALAGLPGLRLDRLAETAPTVNPATPAARVSTVR